MIEFSPLSELSTSNQEINNLIFLQKKREKQLSWTKEEDEILLKKGKEYKNKKWKIVASFLPGHSSIQCSARYKRIQSGIKKGSWNKEEDKILLELYDKYGKNWAKISKEMRTRTGKQIRDRFLNSLDKGIDKSKFTINEDEEIIKLYKIYGNSWCFIAKFLKGRTGDMVKNRFYSRLIKIINNNIYTQFTNNLNNNDYFFFDNENLNDNDSIKINQLNYIFFDQDLNEKNKCYDINYKNNDNFSGNENINENNDNFYEGIDVNNNYLSKDIMKTISDDDSDF